jgi:sec-independent protein translocase protein TatB
MFDFGIGYTEIAVIAIVAVIVIGPKDLPKVLRAFGQTLGKMRGMAREFQGHLDQAMKEAGLEDVKKEVQNLKSSVESAANPIKAVKSELAADLKKHDDDFKKYFGEIGDKMAEPVKPAEPGKIASPAAEASKPAA